MKPRVEYPLQYYAQNEGVLHVSAACLRNPQPGRNLLQIINGTQTFSLAVLEVGKVENASCSLYFDAKSDCVMINKGDSSMHLTGFFSPRIGIASSTTRLKKKKKEKKLQKKRATTASKNDTDSSTHHTRLFPTSLGAKTTTSELIKKRRYKKETQDSINKSEEARVTLPLSANQRVKHAASSATESNSVEDILRKLCGARTDDANDENSQSSFDEEDEEDTEFLKLATQESGEFEDPEGSTGVKNERCRPNARAGSKRDNNIMGRGKHQKNSTAKRKKNGRSGDWFT